MKILQKDLKHGLLKLKTESEEDLWYLEKIIQQNDIVSGMSERKIRIGSSDEKSKISRVHVFLKIRVEKISFDDTLRLLGPIIEGPEDIPKGDYHTFNVGIGTVLTIEKEKWSVYELKKIEQSTITRNNILIVAFDREDAIFAVLKNNGYEILLEIKGEVTKKGFEEKKSDFYNKIISSIKEYDQKFSFNSIILASPAFWKEYLLNELNDEELRKKITLATCSSIDSSTINEILKRPELKTVLEKDKSFNETIIVDELLKSISKGIASYGFKEVQSKISAGNVSVLLISENLIRKMRSEKKSSEIDYIMQQAENINADVRIISSADALKKLDGLSGIACVLRWKEEY
ncbi:MAG: mRNA surveillance protein pelota [Candidatus Woesearchaeota archaeon]